MGIIHDPDTCQIKDCATCCPMPEHDYAACMIDECNICGRYYTKLAASYSKSAAHVKKRAARFTALPSEVDSPASLMNDLRELRNEALSQGDFKYAVHLSHVHKWMHWLVENFDALVTLNKE